MKRDMKILGAAFAVVMAFGLAGCGGAKVQRVDAGSTTDVSGKWNDTDSRLVSEEMISDMLSRPWIERHRAEEGDMPTVIVGRIRNLSHEFINTQTFTNDIERELVNSGRVEFVADRTERTDVRDERADQDINAREDSRNAMGQEEGADFMLSGSINTIVDAAGDRQVVFYQVDLELISMKDNRKVWLGQKKIKKDIERSGFRF
ncbi:MAG: penicillin-binding protein activator LpoB [Gammaproteobacteria bacterium]|nr:penicillin-binding protein activator LpoB [Gammaproteobacteria bacterium]